MSLSRSLFNHWFTDTLNSCTPHIATLKLSGHIYEALNMFHHLVYTCTNCLWWCQVFDRGISRAPDEAATERVFTSTRRSGWRSWVSGEAGHCCALYKVVSPATSRRCCRLSRGVRGSRSSSQIILAALRCILSRVERCDGAAPPQARQAYSRVERIWALYSSCRPLQSRSQDILLREASFPAAVLASWEMWLL